MTREINNIIVIYNRWEIFLHLSTNLGVEEYKCFSTWNTVFSLWMITCIFSVLLRFLTTQYLKIKKKMMVLITKSSSFLSRNPRRALWGERGFKWRLGLRKLINSSHRLQVIEHSEKKWTGVSLMILHKVHNRRTF